MMPARLQNENFLALVCEIRYGLPGSSGYEDPYQRYKNYFQKRNYMDRDYGDFMSGRDNSDGEEDELGLLRKSLLGRISGNEDSQHSADPSRGIGRGARIQGYEGVRKDGVKSISQTADRSHVKSGEESLVKKSRVQQSRLGTVQKDLQQQNQETIQGITPASSSSSTPQQSVASSPENPRLKLSSVNSHEETQNTEKKHDSEKMDTAKHYHSNKNNKADVRNIQPFQGLNFMRKRKRRHVGPHDDSGLQRLLSTGTLAPSTLPEGHPDRPHSIDVVFGTYWFYPAKTRAILPEDQQCIDRGMAKEAQRFDPASEC